MTTETPFKSPAKTEQRKNAWKNLPDVWALIKPRRGILALGFVLMAINRLAGLVLPASTKYLVDNVISKRQIQLLTPIVLAVLTATVVQGLTSFTLTQLLSKSAQKMIAEHRPASDFVLRCQQNGRARLPHHERRGRRPQSYRDRLGGVCRRDHDRSHRAGLLDSYERDHDRRRVWHPARFWIRDQQSLCDHPPDIPRTAENQRGSHRTPHRIA